MAGVRSDMRLKAGYPATMVREGAVGARNRAGQAESGKISPSVR